jgi:hypothetical protein
LDANQISQLFERYKQMRPGRSGGSGLGLVLAQQITHAFGSDIVVTSPWQEEDGGAQATGTSMSMVLRSCCAAGAAGGNVLGNGGGLAPMALGGLGERESAAAAQAGFAAEEAGFAAVRGLRGILVVEDEALNRMIMRAKVCERERERERERDHAREGESNARAAREQRVHGALSHTRTPAPSLSLSLPPSLPPS